MVTMRVSCSVSVTGVELSHGFSGIVVTVVPVKAHVRGEAEVVHSSIPSRDSYDVDYGIKIRSVIVYATRPVIVFMGGVRMVTVEVRELPVGIGGW